MRWGKLSPGCWNDQMMILISEQQRAAVIYFTPKPREKFQTQCPLSITICMPNQDWYLYLFVQRKLYKVQNITTWIRLSKYLLDFVTYFTKQDIPGQIQQFFQKIVWEAARKGSNSLCCTGPETGCVLQQTRLPRPLSQVFTLSCPPRYRHTVNLHSRTDKLEK